VLKEANDDGESIPVPARRFLDKDDGKITTESYAKYEAALWQECSEHFECETEAYSRLGDLQGKLIPRMLAHVRLLAVGGKPQGVLPAGIPPEAASYFEIRGILLEYIDG
jgi:hypothetical protein